jgi:sigma-E factor negative regulatory protein RseA
MNINNSTQEQISAFADGEVSDSQSEVALAALRASENRATWDLYHQIGDTLRSEDMGFEMSPGFAARFAKRLEQEPTILAPEIFQQKVGRQAQTASSVNSSNPIKRFWLQGVATAAAVATLALVAAPQLMVASKDAPAPIATTTMLAATTPDDAHVTAQQEGVVLRDPGIDEYLLAHQRFSPSVYSTAQYARSATFAIDTNK